MLKIRAKNVIIATGSIERPLVFNNNDRPGIMLSSAVKKYADYYGVVCGKNNVFFTNNDSAYETAIEFKKNGIWPIVLDTRSNPDSEIIDEAKRMGITIKFSYVVVAAKGYKKVVPDIAERGVNNFFNNIFSIFRRTGKN